jgi:uncharacterized membrane protein
MAATPARVRPRSLSAGWWLVGAAALATAVLFGPRMLEIAGGARLHGPDLALLARQSWVVRLHLLTAIGTLALGGLLLSMRKGKTFHRTAGWAWVALMLATAGSSLFIVGLNGDMWSLIHVVSGWVLLTLPLGVVAARRHNVVRHRRIMTGIFVGGSVVAGSFAFLPGRLMWNLFLG